MSTDNQLTHSSREGKVEATFLIDCLNAWVDALNKLTVLVLDNAPTHQVKAFLNQLSVWQEKN